MKREKIIEKPLLVIVIICCGILWSFLQPSPISKMDFTGCTIATYHEEKEIYLTPEETSEFVKVLEQAEIGMKLGERYKGFVGGRFKEYKAYLENGEKIEIATYDSMLIIDKCGYTCDQYTIDWLDSCWESYWGWIYQ